MITLAELGLSPERMRIQTALHSKSLRVGRRGLPAEAVQRMYWDYQRLGSIAKVARLYGRTAQSIWEMFRRRHLSLKPDSRARRGDTKLFDGRVFTRGKMGWRETRGERLLMHHVIWEKHFGPVTAGHQVSFRNGDFDDVRIENLFCTTPAEVTRHHLRRLYPKLMRLTPEQRLARKKKVQLQGYYRKRRIFWQAGLRCDGSPLTRTIKGRMRATPKYFPPAEVAARQQPAEKFVAEK